MLLAYSITFLYAWALGSGKSYFAKCKCKMQFEHLVFLSIQLNQTWK